MMLWKRKAMSPVASTVKKVVSRAGHVHQLRGARLADAGPGSSNQCFSRQGINVTHQTTFAVMAGFVAAAIATAAAAQNFPVQSAGELEEVMVTGSRLQASRFNTPTPVTMIDAEAIAQRAPANIADVIYEASTASDAGK